MATKVRHITQSLKVPLSAIDKEAAIRDLNAVVDQRTDTTKLLKSVKAQAKDLKDSISGCDAQIDRISEELKSGRETAIPCDMYLNWDEHTVRAIRIDTGEIVEDRPMTEADQPELSDEDIDMGHNYEEQQDEGGYHGE